MLKAALVPMTCFTKRHNFLGADLRVQETTNLPHGITDPCPSDHRVVRT